LTPDCSKTMTSTSAGTVARSGRSHARIDDPKATSKASQGRPYSIGPELTPPHTRTWIHRAPAAGAADNGVLSTTSPSMQRLASRSTAGKMAGSAAGARTTSKPLRCSRGRPFGFHDPGSDARRRATAIGPRADQSDALVHALGRRARERARRLQDRGNRRDLVRTPFRSCLEPAGSCRARF
jgi:hypothetical protein